MGSFQGVITWVIGPLLFGVLMMTINGITLHALNKSNCDDLQGLKTSVSIMIGIGALSAVLAFIIGWFKCKQHA